MSELRRSYPLTLLLQIAQLPRSSYYYHAARLLRPAEHVLEREAILKI